MLYIHLFIKFVEFAQEMSAVIRDYYEGRTETVMISRRNCAAIFAVADRTAFASIHFVRPSVAVRTCRFAEGVRGKLRNSNGATELNRLRGLRSSVGPTSDNSHTS